MNKRDLTEIEIKEQNSSSINNSDYALTTFDNPYDPFSDFTNWFLFDSLAGYNSCGYLARIARTSELMSEKEKQIEIERAIDEIIQYDFANIYRKVKNPKLKEKES